MTTRVSDPTEHGGPAGLMKAMQKDPQKYGGIKPLPERGKGSETKIAGRNDVDLDAIYRQMGYSKPIADMSEMSRKYLGFLRDGNVESLDEKAAIDGALAIHEMIINSECGLRKMRYEAEEEAAQGFLNRMSAERRPRAFHFDPYLVTNGDAETAIMRDYLESLEDDQIALEGEDGEEDGEEDDDEAALSVIPQQRKRGRPRKEEQKPATRRIPLVEDLVNKWGACDAYMFQVLLEEERHGIDEAEQYYDNYERVEKIRRDTEFLAALLPPEENGYFWCRLRQMSIIRERSYDIAMGYPVHDYSDVIQKLNDGSSIHDLAHQLDWSFQNAYRRVMGSMLDGKEFRLTMTAMIAQQVPLSPQLMQMMQSPPGAFWQGQPWGGQPQGQPAEGEEQVQDKRGAIFNFFKRNQGGGAQQPQQKNTRRRQRRGSS